MPHPLYEITKEICFKDQLEDIYIFNPKENYNQRHRFLTNKVDVILHKLITKYFTSVMQLIIEFI